MGYETVETETAEEGLRVARAMRRALILMHIQLKHERDRRPQLLRAARRLATQVNLALATYE